MIVFFALLGISCKRKIPEAHTSLEVVRIRYGETVRRESITKSSYKQGESLTLSS
jgi:hypothetical protein